MDSLNTDLIHSIANPNQEFTLSCIEAFDLIDSTNAYLLRESAHRPWKGYRICLTEEQTAGRGRYDHQWSSPRGNIYLSIGYSSPLVQPAISLGLIIALQIVKALHSLFPSVNFSTKWPNDILVSGKKLGGILIETTPTAQQQKTFIIGIGINVLGPKMTDSIDRAWTALQLLSPEVPAREIIIGHILHQIFQALPIFTQQGIKPFLKEWYRHDFLLNKTILLETAQRVQKGLVKGITNQGELILKDVQGTLKHIASGHVLTTG